MSSKTTGDDSQPASTNSSPTLVIDEAVTFNQSQQADMELASDSALGEGNPDISTPLASPVDIPEGSDATKTDSMMRSRSSMENAFNDFSSLNLSDYFSEEELLVLPGLNLPDVGITDSDEITTNAANKIVSMAYDLLVNKVSEVDNRLKIKVQDQSQQTDVDDLLSSPRLLRDVPILSNTNHQSSDSFNEFLVSLAPQAHAFMNGLRLDIEVALGTIGTFTNNFAKILKVCEPINPKFSELYEDCREVAKLVSRIEQSTFSCDFDWYDCRKMIQPPFPAADFAKQCQLESAPKTPVGNSPAKNRRNKKAKDLPLPPKSPLCNLPCSPSTSIYIGIFDESRKASDIQTVRNNAVPTVSYERNFTAESFRDMFRDGCSELEPKAADGSEPYQVSTDLVSDRLGLRLDANRKLDSDMEISDSEESQLQDIDDTYEDEDGEFELEEGEGDEEEEEEEKEGIEEEEKSEDSRLQPSSDSEIVVVRKKSKSSKTSGRAKTSKTSRSSYRKEDIFDKKGNVWIKICKEVNCPYFQIAKEGSNYSRHNRIYHNKKTNGQTYIKRKVSKDEYTRRKKNWWRFLRVAKQERNKYNYRVWNKVKFGIYKKLSKSFAIDK